MTDSPRARDLLRAWIDIGSQSVGGGTSTLFMIRRVLVDQRRWITPREFTEAYALSQLSPGIHFVAMAGLLGRRLGGTRGVVIAVAGMMVPASLITAIMTAFFAAVAEHPIALAALAGIAPIAAGMTLGQAVILGRPVIHRGPRGILDLAVAIAAALVVLTAGGSTIAVVLASGLVGALFLRGARPTSQETEMS
ncbi:MAG TPA: chromate transporter [Candidatus Limnocylindria bacterium]|nr:chromate transporter [Candidatus Limnocylindria bacterium]